jgi:hypothetical protein
MIQQLRNEAGRTCLLSLVMTTNSALSLGCQLSSSLSWESEHQMVHMCVNSQHMDVLMDNCQCLTMLSAFRLAVQSCEFYRKTVLGFNYPHDQEPSSPALVGPNVGSSSEKN